MMQHSGPITAIAATSLAFATLYFIITLFRTGNTSVAWSAAIGGLVAGMVVGLLVVLVWTMLRALALYLVLSMENRAS